MDLKKVKIGDEVYSCLKGWGKVIELRQAGFKVNYRREFEQIYYYDGLTDARDINPEITDWKPKKRKWEPSIKTKGSYRITAHGTIVHAYPKTVPDNIHEGRVYNTQTQAKHAYKSIRACQILNAYVAEFAPDWRADWGDSYQTKAFIYSNHHTDEWFIGKDYTHQSFSIVYMPKETAEQLCKDLNNGIVKL